MVEVVDEVAVNVVMRKRIKGESAASQVNEYQAFVTLCPVFQRLTSSV